MTTTRMRRRSLLGLLAAGATTPALAACGSAVTGEDPAEGGEDGGTVRVGHLSSSLFTPLYVAEAMDYFAEEGITIELVPIQSGQDGIPMLSTDQLAVMVGGLSTAGLNELKQGRVAKNAGPRGTTPAAPDPS